MTAINIITFADSIVILNDGAWCDPRDGVLRAIAPKTFALPQLPGAFATRGPANLGPFLQSILQKMPSLDEILQSLTSAVEVMIEEFPMAVGGGQMEPAFEIVIAGFSHERERLEAYLIPWHDGYKDKGTPAKGLMPLWGVRFAPVPLPETGWICPELANFHPVKDGIALLDAQRRTKGPLNVLHPDGPAGHVVGGMAQITQITQRGVWSEIIHRWPDVVGETIRPAAGDASRSQKLAMLTQRQPQQ